jgi:ribosome-binding ATPase YchF (GTP1/OBG family)
VTFKYDSSSQKGTKAPQAAGRIHTDMEKGFIMAEVMKFDDFKEEGSETAVKVSRSEAPPALCSN